MEERKKEFTKNQKLESLLYSLNENLCYAEERALEKYQATELSQPVLFVMGPLRSGTTLMMQWLANSGLVSYPTNLLSRFYRAPIVGSQIQQILTNPEYSFRNELVDAVVSIGYSSQNGKTEGMLAPNEFWYFWRRFLSDPDRDVWSDQELYDVFDKRTFCRELNGITDVLGKPFALKGMMFNYNIRFLATILPGAKFIHIKRDQFDNAEAVLDARIRQFGNIDKWYSFDIPEKSWLMRLGAEHQSAGQVYCINRAIEHGLSALPESRKLNVAYEDFCENPAGYFESITDILHLKAEYNGPKSFKRSRRLSESRRNYWHGVFEEIIGYKDSV